MSSVPTTGRPREAPGLGGGVGKASEEEILLRNVGFGDQPRVKEVGGGGHCGWEKHGSPV